MADDNAGTDQRGERRPYLKPFVRNLDAVDTQGGKFAVTAEFTSAGTIPIEYGPS
jgi:hypothetical protein